MVNLFTIIFYQPVLNLLVFLYNTISFHDLGVAIILMTAIIKIAFWPLGQTALKSQKALQDLQPKLEELKKKYGDDKVGLSQATMAMYQDNKVNPFSSCLPLLIQLPFLFAVYRVFTNGLHNKFDLVYFFLTKPEMINTISFGFLDLSRPNIVLAILAGAAQFFQGKMLITSRPATKTPDAQDENMAAIMNKQMLYMMPALTVFIGWSLPGGLTLYWFVLTLITLIQQFFVFRHKKDGAGTPGAITNGKIIDGELAK
jgi:YidC/Oxa1 family membrane protein insertase